MCSLLKLICFLILIVTAHCSSVKTLSSKAKPTHKNSSSLISRSCSQLPAEISQAWNSARTISGRNPNNFRLDKENDVIISSQLSKGSPISFCAAKKMGNGAETFIPVRNGNGQGSALRYNFEAENIMNLIEIALVGYVSDERGKPACFVPSEIHTSIIQNDQSALEWQIELFKNNPINGRYGHEAVFDEMGLKLNNIYRYPFMSALFVQNNIPHCKAYVTNSLLRNDLTDCESVSSKESAETTEIAPKRFHQEIDEDGFVARVKVSTAKIRSV